MNSSNELNTINLPVISLYQKASLMSKVTTQALYGENFKVLEKRKKWHLIELKDDCYKGWISKYNHKIFFESTHRVNITNTWVLSSPDIKSKPIMKLYAGSKLKVFDFHDSWALVKVYKKKFINGYIPKSHLIDLNKHMKWLKIIKQFENAPYFWGGKTINGIDCSGLLQLATKFKGLNIPRDTKDQEKYFKKNIFKSKNLDIFNDFKKGDIIFWKGHVAIAINKNKLIHANAHHMNVKIETIVNALKRINQEYIVKRI